MSFESVFFLKLYSNSIFLTNFNRINLTLKLHKTSKNLHSQLLQTITQKLYTTNNKNKLASRWLIFHLICPPQRLKQFYLTIKLIFKASTLLLK